MSQTNMKRICSVVAGILLVCLTASPAETDNSKRVVTAMTRNMDAGTDLNLIFALYPDIKAGVTATIQEVIATDVPGRAARLADEIRTSHPDLIALQEVTEWRQGQCGATTLLYDQLQLLMDSLAARHMRYKVLAVQSVAAIEAPAATGCVKMIDRNAILVTADEKAAGIEIDNIQSVLYATTLDLSKLGFSGFPVIYHGYITADVQAGSERFRFVNTHLDSIYPFDPQGSLQVAEAAELVTALAASPLPVVLCGDFNSNAEAGPEQTATVGMILNIGFTDVWREFNPVGTGYTWPLYSEDPLGGPTVPVERIDLIFTRGVRPLKVVVKGLTAPWASDHAGVVSMLQPGK
jgi:endonuclease/exonuclease/phosphatase family metal-dependent hydrolase